MRTSSTRGRALEEPLARDDSGWLNGKLQTEQDFDSFIAKGETIRRQFHVKGAARCKLACPSGVALEPVSQTVQGPYKVHSVLC